MRKEIYTHGKCISPALGFLGAHEAAHGLLGFPRKRLEAPRSSHHGCLKLTGASWPEKNKEIGKRRTEREKTRCTYTCVEGEERKR